MKKFLILFLFFCFFPLNLFAQEEKKDEIFKAEVLEVIRQEARISENGDLIEQQDLKLKGLESQYQGKIFDFYGISEVVLTKTNLYKKGDRVLATASQNAEGEIVYYVIEPVRTSALFWLFLFFVALLLLVSRWRGVRALLSLALSFLVIIYFLIPKILNGADPLLITFLSSFFILLIIVYGTEGFKTRAHISVLSIFLSLSFTIFLAWFFVDLVKLTGFSNEESSFLITLGYASINFKGLLLAGIIIGSLGVLDDVVISQVASVEQLLKVDAKQSGKEVFKKAYEIGVAHIGSMTNTLFLAYAGVSLPLLILFVSGQSAFSSLFQIVNSEVIATEIVRTLAGSLGLLLSVPISTFLAIAWFKSQKH